MTVQQPSPRSRRYRFQVERSLPFPPFGVKYDPMLAERDLFGRFPEKTASIAVLAVRHILARTKGRAVVAVPNGLLFSPGAERSLREELLAKKQIEAVIALPAALLPNTALPFSLLILNREKANDEIVFVDGAKDVLFRKDGNQSMATVDVTVWFWGRLGMADDKPGMRLIAWNMLKAGLEERLREEILQDFNWRLILDSPEKLRFSEAGLSIQPDRSLFGETVPGTTSATIRQSPWTEGLELEMMIRHDTSLPLPLFQKLQEKLGEQYWEAANDPHFAASLDMEASMMMTDPMSYQELAEWVAEQIEKALPGLTTIRG